MDEITIGARLRTLRRWRGLTQIQLADLAGVSDSFISAVEKGQRPLDRRSHIADLASALRVSETDLVGGPHLTPDPLQSDPHMAIPPLRIALETNSLSRPAVDWARPLSELAHLVTDEIEPMRRICDYIGMGRLLPDVLDELHYYVAAPADEAAEQLALKTLVEACALANFTARSLNYPDLAHVAATRAQEAAIRLGDPVSQGKADFAWLHTLPRAGSWNRILAAAERAADRLEPHARDPLGRQVLGMISLTTALSAAASHQGATATHWLAEAARIGRHVSDEPMTNWQSFSATNVNIWQVTIGLERGEAGGAILELAEQVDLDKFERHHPRRADFMSDVGRGLAREPKTRSEAVQWLRRAEEAAPQRVRNSAAARETVAYLLNRARAESGSRELRGMAARMGVPHSAVP